MGTAGTVLVDRDGYEIYDLKGGKTSEFKVGTKTTSADLVGSDSMTDAHFANFIDGVRKGENSVPRWQMATSRSPCFSSLMSRGKCSETASRPEGRTRPGRSRSFEVVGPRVREGLGAACLS